MFDSCPQEHSDFSELPRVTFENTTNNNNSNNSNNGNTIKTHNWLTSSGLQSETEGFITAAQEQSLPTPSYYNGWHRPYVDLSKKKSII